MDDSSGVGVIDKSVALLEAASHRPSSLADLVAATGIARPTAHRLAVALERHRLLSRDDQGRFVIGSRLLQWGGDSDPLIPRAQAVVADLRDRLSLSAQVYRRQGEGRLCLAAAEPPSGLRDGVPVGAFLSMQAGSAAQILVAWLPSAELDDALRGAAFSARDLNGVRRRGWAQSAGQREPGVASISAPVLDADGEVIAAVSVSGPLGRLSRPSKAQVAALLVASEDLSALTTTRIPRAHAGSR